MSCKDFRKVELRESRGYSKIMNFVAFVRRSNICKHESDEPDRPLREICIDWLCRIREHTVRLATGSKPTVGPSPALTA